MHGRAISHHVNELKERRLSGTVQECWTMMACFHQEPNHGKFAVPPSFLCLSSRCDRNDAEGARDAAWVGTTRRAPARTRAEGFGEKRSMVGGASRQEVGSPGQYRQPQGLIWDLICPTPELP